jgi:phosphotransacetylase
MGERIVELGGILVSKNDDVDPLIYRAHECVDELEDIFSQPASAHDDDNSETAIVRQLEHTLQTMENTLRAIQHVIHVMESQEAEGSVKEVLDHTQERYEDVVNRYHELLQRDDVWISLEDIRIQDDPRHKGQVIVRINMRNVLMKQAEKSTSPMSNEHKSLLGITEAEDASMSAFMSVRMQNEVLRGAGDKVSFLVFAV